MKKVKDSFMKSPAKVAILLFVLLEILTVILQPGALSMSWINLKAEAAITLLFAAIGETFVLLIGGIDLSIAGVISLTNSFSAVYMRDHPGSMLFISLICICMGAAMGAANGFIINRFRIQPFIVTFATWYIGGGIAYLILPKDGGNVPTVFTSALTHRFFGGRLSIAIFIFVICAGLWMWFKKTRTGINLYAVGSNSKAASLNGVNVPRVKMFAYVASGVFAALSGVYRTAVVATGSPTGGESFFNQAIAAVVIGGTLLTGGKGGQMGTIIGVLVLKMISDILVFAGVSSYWTTLFQGLLLVVAVLISCVSEIIRERKELIG